MYSLSLFVVMEKESTDNSKNLEIGLHRVFGFVGHNLGGVGAPSRGCIWTN